MAGSEHETPPGLFRFECGPYLELKCIPMVVRYKLDLVGIKLGLKQWNRLSQEIRSSLVTGWPVDMDEDRAELRTALQGWVYEACGEEAADLPIDPAPAWQDLDRLTPNLADLGSRCDPPLTVDEWRRLPLLQRFALVKLAGSKHERDRVFDALKEFRGR